MAQVAPAKKEEFRACLLFDDDDYLVVLDKDSEEADDEPGEAKMKVAWSVNYKNIIEIAQFSQS